ncbi:hypothetical protein K3495_g10910 [Podosphaera aphanis]|nr:hypothetical protein K3495_g10910 [Podosphaera aphanis]
MRYSMLFFRLASKQHACEAGYAFIKQESKKRFGREIRYIANNACELLKKPVILCKKFVQAELSFCRDVWYHLKQESALMASGLFAIDNQTILTAIMKLVTVSRSLSTGG